MNKISGVYKITNNITGDFYIGSSIDIKRRWAEHKIPSTWSRYSNSRMYQDMAQYGLNNFQLDIIEETNNLKEREQYWIEQLNPNYNSNRAYGWDIERYKEHYKEYYNNNKDRIFATHKEYMENNKEKYQVYNREHMRKYRQTENGKENNRKCARKSMKRYNNQLCLYDGKTLTLNALSQKFYNQGIPHPTLEAKKYLLSEQ